jgi:thioredoxin-like negative regulator of GroEL
MADLYDDSVIKLYDDDFDFSSSQIKLTNKQFKNKDGYVMIYAPWCPNCQNKVEFWSYLGNQLNHNPQYKAENFRIGVVNSEDPSASQIVRHLQVNAIPRFVHISSGGTVSEYQGQDHSPETLIKEVCQNKQKLCSFK